MAKGSTITKGGWEPALCAGCNERVTTSGKSNIAHGGAFFRFGPPAESWHQDCKRKHFAERRTTSN